MRSLACGADMYLMQVVQDGTMPVPGFERHTFMCSACDDVERRLVFTRDNGQSHVATCAGAPGSAHCASFYSSERVPCGSGGFEARVRKITW